MGSTKPAVTLESALAQHQSGDLDSALTGYTAIIRRQPQNAHALHLLGVLHSQRGEHERAIACLRKAIVLEPGRAAFHSNLGLALHVAGRPLEAETAYRHALALVPDFVEALFNLGNTLHALSRPQEAMEAYRAAVAAHPSHALAYNNLGNVLRESGQTDEARECYESAIRCHPDYADAWTNLGLIESDQGHTKAAVECYRAALALNPRSAEALCNLASALLKEDKLAGQAVEAARLAVEVRPDWVPAWLVLGNALLCQKESELAGDCFRCALELRPGDVEALNGLGAALLGCGHTDEARHCFEQAAAADPAVALSHYHLGNLYKDQGEYKRAEECYLRGLALDPDSAAACNNLGNALEQQQRLEEALEWYGRSLQLNSASAEAHSNVGNILRQLGRTIEAELHSRRAVELNPDLWSACNNLAAILDEQGRSAEALTYYRHAIEVHPNNAVLWYNFGNALADAKQLGGALKAFDKAYELDPDDPNIVVALAIRRQQACDWRDYAALRRRSVEVQASGAADPSPFSLLSVDSTPSEQLAAARLWSQKHQRGVNVLPARSFPGKHDRLRIGYLSADLRKHAVAYLAAELFELHDRSRFEVFAYSYGPDDRSGIRARIANACDQFVNVRSEPHECTAQRIRKDAVDILVDLTGITQFCRPRILAHRAAPIQVNYLGYPGTTGSDYMDYILVDEHIVHSDETAFYSEKVVWLPHSYQVNDRNREVSPLTLTRGDCGLPEQGFVYCCFNNTFKLNPATFDTWMRILRATNGSVLWLLGDNTIAIENLRREAEARGIDAGRLVFAPRCEMPEHLARQKLADLVLDTLPYNAHTTTSDALWVGVPVLTVSEQTFASRVAGSLLTAIGIPELIARSRDEYEAQAVRLAHDPASLQALRNKLAANRTTYPLFDTPKMLQHIEAAYTMMWQRLLRGEGPEHIRVGS